MNQNTFDQIVEEYSKSKSGYIFPINFVEDNLIKANVTIDDLELDKNYFLNDSESYCAYYLVLKRTDEVIVFIPLWRDDEYTFKSGEGNTDLLNAYMLYINDEIITEINELISDYELSSKLSKTMDDLLLIIIDSWHLDEKNEEMAGKVFKMINI